MTISSEMIEKSRVHEYAKKVATVHYVKGKILELLTRGEMPELQLASELYNNGSLDEWGVNIKEDYTNILVKLSAHLDDLVEDNLVVHEVKHYEVPKEFKELGFPDEGSGEVFRLNYDGIANNIQEWESLKPSSQ